MSAITSQLERLPLAFASLFSASNSSFSRAETEEPEETAPTPIGAAITDGTAGLAVCKKGVGLVWAVRFCLFNVRFATIYIEPQKKAALINSSRRYICFQLFQLWTAVRWKSNAVD